MYELLLQPWGETWSWDWLLLQQLAECPQSRPTATCEQHVPTTLSLCSTLVFPPSLHDLTWEPATSWMTDSAITAGLCSCIIWCMYHENLCVSHSHTMLQLHVIIIQNQACTLYACLSYVLLTLIWNILWADENSCWLCLWRVLA